MTLRVVAQGAAVGGGIWQKSKDPHWQKGVSDTFVPSPVKTPTTVSVQLSLRTDSNGGKGAGERRKNQNVKTPQNNVLSCKSATHNGRPGEHPL